MAITWPSEPFTDGQEHSVAGVGVYVWDATLGVWNLLSRESTVLTESDRLDEDDMASDSATAVPSQQSVKAYVTNNIPSAVVETVNGQSPTSGEVTIDPDDLDDTSTTNKFATAAELTKLAGIEAAADVTDADNVSGAGAAMVDQNYVDDLLPVPPLVSSDTALTLTSSLGRRMVLLTSSSAITVTLPTNAAHAHPLGFWSVLSAAGTGTVTVAFDSGVSSYISGANLTVQPGDLISVYKVTTTQWLVSGGTS